ncbi:hypothetical protein EOPP23_13765 [Endozoicomonas sp. OPT23]|uniref:hemerythrin domain-containing protein n=1 Tax=Endozoicomonas sp. OPT23 TaxID=2072845 RepID=UPI00129C0B99|nr:hemerythrin domain-containing protein [Endozoicomonas sp. OPT23]MRI34059.1 hypothetical protein [Endozoicomonas sp. OPT23]
MDKLIERITIDHEHILKLLQAVDYEIKAYDADNDRTPRLAIIVGALDYLQNYPDSFHHPLESQLMKRLKPRVTDSDLLQSMVEIDQQHDQIRELTIELVETVNAISTDHVVPIKKLVSSYQSYVDLQRAHVQKENRVMIPAMKAYLTSEDLELAEQELLATPDPLFGKYLWESYEGLYQYLLEADARQETTV